MSLIGKKFVDTNGMISSVKDVFENIAVFENGKRVNTKLLTDNQYFTEVPSGPRKDYNILKQPIEQISVNRDVIDPDTFLKSRNYTIPMISEDAYKIQSRTEGGSDYYNNQNTAESNPYIQQNEMSDEEILANKYRNIETDRDRQVMQQANRAKQDQKINKALEEEGIKIEIPTRELLEEQAARGTTSIQVDPVTSHHNNNTQNNNAPNTFMDPAIAFLKRGKMDTNFSVNIPINTKIPNINYIRMIEESSDISVIGYLANEIADNILRDPDSLRERISIELKKLIVPKSKTKKIVKEEEGKEEIKPVAKKTIKKQNIPPLPPKERMLEEQRPDKQ
jgi:hypothetical protein